MQNNNFNNGAANNNSNNNGDTYNNIGELADILGHSSLEIIRIYLSSSREEKRNKMNRLNL